jgi:protein tyrosine phosphatase (PTP) superfamily phosphohydrolase (DUF442 family)
MKVDKIALYYPNGQTLMQLGPIEGTVDEITQIAAAGLNDIINKMPALTKNAQEMFEAYEKARAAGLTPPTA